MDIVRARARNQYESDEAQSADMQRMVSEILEASSWEIDELRAKDDETIKRELAEMSIYLVNEEELSAQSS